MTSTKCRMNTKLEEQFETIRTSKFKFIQMRSCSAELGKDDCDDKSVQADSFCENENKNHAHEQLALHRVAADACLTYDADSVAGYERAQSSTETACKRLDALICSKALVCCSRCSDFTLQDHSNN